MWEHSSPSGLYYWLSIRFWLAMFDRLPFMSSAILEIIWHREVHDVHFAFTFVKIDGSQTSDACSPPSSYRPSFTLSHDLFVTYDRSIQTQAALLECIALSAGGVNCFRPCFLRQILKIVSVTIVVEINSSTIALYIGVWAVYNTLNLVLPVSFTFSTNWLCIFGTAEFPLSCILYLCFWDSFFHFSASVISLLTSFTKSSAMAGIFVSTIF